MGNQAREHTGIPSLQIVMPSTSITFKCKLSGSNDLRRRTVPLMDGTVAYATVLEMVTELFQLGGASFKLLWLDEDEDLVTIGTNADVDEAVRWALSASTTLRLEVKLTAPAPDAEQKAEPAPVAVDTPPPPPPHPPLVVPEISNFPSCESEPQNQSAAEQQQNCSAAVDLQQMMQNQLTQLTEHLPEQLEEHVKFAARKIENHLEKRAKQWHKLVPGELKHKADGLCNFLKKTKKKNKNKKLHMKFVADLSLPDRTELMPGDVISKTWRVINSGADTWPDQSRLTHVGSDLFEGARPSAVPCLEPGTETELSLDEMITPAEPGRYMSHWRLCTPEGNKFGDRLWFDVTVLSTQADHTSPPVVHLGIACDLTGMDPIVGPRFKKFTEDYDLCQAAFDTLDNEEKSTFRMINAPEDAAHVAAEEEEHAAELVAAAEDEEQQQMHENIWCDGCSCTPIMGPRYTKQLDGDTYDVCQVCFSALDDSEKQKLTKADKPEADKPAQKVVDDAEAPSAEEPEAAHQDDVDVVIEQEPEAPSVFDDCDDLSASCIADIEATFVEEDEAAAEEAACIAEEEAAAEAARIVAEQEPILPIIPCPQCTFENSPESTQCEICEAVLHSQDGYLSSANCAVKGHSISKRIHAHSKEESIANLVNRTAEMCSADSNAGGFTLNAPAGEVPWTVLKTKVGVTHHRREVDPEKQNKTLYTKV